ncbi:hypothetical protein [Streptomyces sp. FXY-T5]|uniref:hypothetical protein n=1 Tax=Streptomyces sp. FXY-T5 TaxID=3064901 RepID=UPI0027D2A8DB|nr:hypothetical protein [Streptomyces sp. FXY-T5]WMD06859.1 hypothetical protein Q7C01_21825 [Streptomyces sp. FXY-T5]
MLEEVRAPQHGIVLWVRRIRTVRPGDEVVIFGEIQGDIPAMRANSPWPTSR